MAEAGEAAEAATAAEEGAEAEELSTAARRGIRSLEKQIAKHEKKLADFKSNPTPTAP